HWCGAIGTIALVLSDAILILNLSAGSGILFALGVFFTAMGHGMSMLAGMSMITRLAGPANRSGLLSTYLVAGYIGSMIPMMGIGWIVDHWGIETAIYSFCTMVIAIGVPVAVLFQRHPRIRPAVAQPSHSG